MKVKEFLNSLDSSILMKIETLSNALNQNRPFKEYRDFEDIVEGESLETIKLKIKPITKTLPSYLMGN